MMTEAYTSLNKTLRYYGTSEAPIAHFPFNFLLLTKLNYTSNADAFKNVIYDWLDHMPENAWPNWLVRKKL
jgi:alpha-glucosidase